MAEKSRNTRSQEASRIIEDLDNTDKDMDMDSAVTLLRNLFNEERTKRPDTTVTRYVLVPVYQGVIEDVQVYSDRDKARQQRDKIKEALDKQMDDVLLFEKEIEVTVK